MAVGADHDTGWETERIRPSGPEPPSRLSALITIAITVVLFVAIVGGSEIYFNHRAAPTDAATGTTTPASPTSTAAASTTSTTSAVGGSGNPADIPAAQPNPPSLAAAYTPDPVVVLKTLSTYIDWVFSHPNPALVANYMLPSSRNYSGVTAELQTMVKNDWHARPSITGIVFAKANFPFQPAPATHGGHQAYNGTILRVVTQDTPQSSDVLNAAGQVVASLHNPAQEFLIVALAQGSDGQFRISDIGQINPPGGISAFES